MMYVKFCLNSYFLKVPTGMLQKVGSILQISNDQYYQRTFTSLTASGNLVNEKILSKNFEKEEIFYLNYSLYILFVCACIFFFVCTSFHFLML